MKILGHSYYSKKCSQKKFLKIMNIITNPIDPSLQSELKKGENNSLHYFHYTLYNR